MTAMLARLLVFSLVMVSGSALAEQQPLPDMPAEPTAPTAPAAPSAPTAPTETATPAAVEPGTASTPTSQLPTGEPSAPADAKYVHAGIELSGNALAEFMKSYVSYDEDKGFTEGKHHSPLERDVFYQRIGRSDLVEQSDSLKLRKNVLLVGACAVALAGIIGAVAAVASNPDPNSVACNQDNATYNRCIDRGRNDDVLAAGSVVVGGLAASVMAWFGFHMNLEPVDSSEAKRLASQYNGELRRRLSLGSSRETEPSTRSMTLGMTMTPDAHGGQLMLRFGL
jgi:hypothetical protein